MPNGRLISFLTCLALGACMTPAGPPSSTRSIPTGPPSWSDKAVIYGVNVWFHALGHEPHGLKAVTARIPELTDLGINTIWLQPIFEAAEVDHGYGVTDYFKIAEEHGTEKDLHELVETAHGNGIRILLDLPLNHTSVEHPWVQDILKEGNKSAYWGLYMHELPQKPLPWGEKLKVVEHGGVPFVVYFWDSLVNLDYDDQRVKDLTVEVSKYWIEEFDVDGYRFDASWGPWSRWPHFYRTIRREVKRLKPDALLLAEDKATVPEFYQEFFETLPLVYDEGFDVAYDWTADRWYISEWPWHVYEGEAHETIFNTTAERERASALRDAITAKGDPKHPRGKILRFIENNDTIGFHDSHNIEQFRMASTLQFALPGIPLIFYGQEIAAKRPREYVLSTFDPSRRLETYETAETRGTWRLYKKLIELKTTERALIGDNYEELPVRAGNGQSAVFAFRRWADDQNIIALVNMSDETVGVTIETPLLSGEGCRLVDLLEPDRPALDCDRPLPITRYTTRLFILAKARTSMMSHP